MLKGRIFGYLVEKWCDQIGCLRIIDFHTTDGDVAFGGQAITPVEVD